MPENYPGIITQNVILSAAFDPTGNVNPSTDAPGARFTTATNGSQISAYSHWQDTVPDGIRGTTSGSAGPNKPDIPLAASSIPSAKLTAPGKI